MGQEEWPERARAVAGLAVVMGARGGGPEAADAGLSDAVTAVQTPRTWEKGQEGSRTGHSEAPGTWAELGARAAGGRPRGRGRFWVASLGDGPGSIRVARELARPPRGLQARSGRRGNERGLNCREGKKLGHLEGSGGGRAPGGQCGAQRSGRLRAAGWRPGGVVPPRPFPRYRSLSALGVAPPDRSCPVGTTRCAPRA